MLKKLSAIILAGGESKRMEYNKEYIKIKDSYLIHNQIKVLSKLFEEVIVVTNNPDHYKDLNVIVTKDILNGKSPMIGLHAGLKKSKYEYSYVVACDMPYIDTEFIDYLVTKISNHEAYVSKHNGFLEPFSAIYSKSITNKIELFINENNYGFQKMINKLDTFYIEEKEIAIFLKKTNIFKNINNESDLYEITNISTSPSTNILMNKVINNEMFETNDKVVTEYPLSLSINNSYYITLMITPVNIEFLIYGFLNAEMLITNIKDVKNLEIDLVNHQANVTLVSNKTTYKKYKAEFLSSACGASPKIKEKLNNNIINTITNNLVLSSKTIFENVQRFNHESILFKETGGVHSVALINNSSSKLFEDIGRHNAIDKAVGYMMKNSLNSNNMYILTSGRISSDILLKCALANISIIISRSAPTSLSINLAKQLGVTIAGFTRGNKMNIYTNPHRIELIK